MGTITQTTIAVRIKGIKRVIEGKLIEDHGVDTVILMAQPDEILVGAPMEYIESIWFLGHWMTLDQFNSYQ